MFLLNVDDLWCLPCEMHIYRWSSSHRGLSSWACDRSQNDLRVVISMSIPTFRAWWCRSHCPKWWAPASLLEIDETLQGCSVHTEMALDISPYKRPLGTVKNLTLWRRLVLNYTNYCRLYGIWCQFGSFSNDSSHEYILQISHVSPTWYIPHLMFLQWIIVMDDSNLDESSLHKC